MSDSSLESIIDRMFPQNAKLKLAAEALLENPDIGNVLVEVAGMYQNEKLAENVCRALFFVGVGYGTAALRDVLDFVKEQDTIDVLRRYFSECSEPRASFIAEYTVYAARKDAEVGRLLIRVIRSCSAEEAERIVEETMTRVTGEYDDSAKNYLRNYAHA